MAADPLNHRRGSTWLLGVDGGASRTRAALAHVAGDRPEPAGRGETTASNPRCVGPAAAAQAIAQAIAAAFAQAGCEPAPIASAVIGLAGAADPHRREQVEQALRRRVPIDRLWLTTDVELLLSGDDPRRRPRIAVIAGTGSIAWGLAPDGRTARAGGLGCDEGDPGSGLWIARQALARRTAATPTTIAHAIESAAGAANEAVATLAREIVRAAEQGDPWARPIVDDAAAELAARVGEVARELDLRGGPYELVLAGSVAVHSPRLTEQLLKQLAAAGIPPARPSIVADAAELAVQIAWSRL